MSEVVTCTVCDKEVGRGPGGLGQISHANAHRREFQAVFERKPEDYQEVRDRLGKAYPYRGDDDQLTLFEAITDDEQASLPRGTQWG